MKTTIGSYSFKTESYLLGANGRLSFPTLFNYLIHAASAHATERGFGFVDMTNQHTAWVLSRMAIEVVAYPTFDQSITVYTWVDEVNKLFTCRNFQLCNAAGESIAWARSIWAAIDLQTRKPTLLDIEGLSSYLVPERPCPISKPSKIKPIEQTSVGVEYTVKYSDLDINNHLNSAKYIEHLLDLFPLEKFENQQIQRFEIAYMAEGQYGMSLSLHHAAENDTTDLLAVCHEGKTICRAKAIWK